MAHGVTPEALAEAIERSPGVESAFIVSPTYYGMAADIGGCAEVAHVAGVALVVDCAWGSHFGFHPILPDSPLSVGADAVLTSTHKIVGSLTQSAMLHVAADGLVDPDEVARCVRLMRSTSPNSLLLASLDSARRQLAAHGEALLDRTLAAAARARVELERSRGAPVVGEELVGRPGIAGWDPLRIVIGTSAGPAAPVTRSPPSCVPPTTSTSSSPRTRRSCSCSEWASRSIRWNASRTTSPKPSAGSPSPARSVDRPAGGGARARHRRADPRGVPRRGRAGRRR